MEVIFFSAERGLSFFGFSQRIGDRNNENFLGIIELLSKYDPLLLEHIKKVRKSQENQQRMQIYYLSTHIQNKFIKLCGSFVQKFIIEDIHNAKYFAIIVDATPDCSHKEQTNNSCNSVCKHCQQQQNIFN